MNKNPTSFKHVRALCGEKSQEDPLSGEHLLSVVWVLCIIFGCISDVLLTTHETVNWHSLVVDLSFFLICLQLFSTFGLISTLRIIRVSYKQLFNLGLFTSQAAMISSRAEELCVGAVEPV